LAYVHALHGDWDKAGELMDAVGAALWRTDSRVVPLFYFGLFGLTALKRGDLEKAERIIASNLTLTRDAGSEHFEAEALRVQAQIRGAQGQNEQAGELFKQAIQIFERLGSRLELGKALYFFGQAQMEWGEKQSARETIERALQIFQECKASYWVAKARELTT
jgi:tetratricopeptide (TPR) repeat protein